MILFRASRFGPLSSLRSALCLAPRSYILSTRSYSNPPENIEQRSLVGKILHGSPTAQAESKQTHSAILARGKYVHEIQKHRVKPECVEEYIALVSEHYPRIAEQGQGDVKLTGSWMTSVGDQDTAVHIWEFTGYQGQALAYDRLRQDPAYLDYQKRLRPLIRSRENQVCLEFAFWPTAPPRVTGGIYELRTYDLKPGNMLEWEAHWKKGLECKRPYCEPVGAWFAQLGNLNVVHHMWQYPDLATRKRTREEAWQAAGWPETVYHTVRLANRMKAHILEPLPFSSLR
ncbi:MAG: hypothetical protein DHS80DRAFT_18665 [Piptocephalis tieghemiana]|nr:MAG: hypothetical protein DHS80DRAFT_18665 [Piptocephalis tieghemiana]